MVLHPHFRKPPYIKGVISFGVILNLSNRGIPKHKPNLAIQHPQVGDPEAQWWALITYQEVWFQPPMALKNFILRRNIIYKYIPWFCGNYGQILVGMGLYFIDFMWKWPEYGLNMEYQGKHMKMGYPAQLVLVWRKLLVKHQTYPLPYRGFFKLGHPKKTRGFHKKK